jgi:hypothetical protein
VPTPEFFLPDQGTFGLTRSQQFQYAEPLSIWDNTFSALDWSEEKTAEVSP